MGTHGIAAVLSHELGVAYGKLGLGVDPLRRFKICGTEKVILITTTSESGAFQSLVSMQIT